MKRPSAASVSALSALAAAITYAAAALNGYVYDDVAIIRDQPLYHSLRNIPRLVVSPWWISTQRLYRPLSQISLCVDWALAGGAPWLAHAENVALHALAAFLLTRLALRFLSTEGALVAGLVFALAPAHVEAVSTAVGRAELLSGIFILLALLLCTTERESTPARRLALAALSALALASKEVGVIAPAVVLAATWLSDTQRRRAWEWTMAAIAGVVPMLLARLIVLRTLTGDLPHPAFRITGLAGREAIAFATLPRTIVYLFLPITAPVDVAPTLSQVRDPNLLFVGAGVTLAVLGVVVLVAHFRRPSPFTLGAWIVAAGISPTANILFASGVVLAGRGLYAPSIGAALCCGAVVSTVWSWSARRAVRLAVFGAAGVWLLIGAAVSVTRIGMWRNRERLVNTMVAIEPDSYRSHYFAAALEAERGRPGFALEHYRAGMSLFPSDVMFDTDAARAAVIAGDTTLAIQWLTDAVSTSAEHSFLARTRLALLLRARGDSAAALRVVRDGLAVLPDQRIWRDMLAQLSPHRPAVEPHR